MKQPAVYIMASRRNGTLYTGVTANLLQRVHQHRERSVAREKQIKTGSRRKKFALIEAMNPAWRDLYDELA
jgi:putative endonuclease